MPNLFTKSTIHRLMNVKYCTIKRSNTNYVITTIEQFARNKSFKNLDVNEMVFLFNRIIKYISNYIPHEIIICNDQDPAWINNGVKKIINEKNHTFQCYLYSNKDPKLFKKAEYLQNILKSLIEANKRIVTGQF